jgi:ferredoxin-fold anticodon binding domain-containing protein
MKKSFLILTSLVLIFGCATDNLEKEVASISYDLHQSSDFNFGGKATFNQLNNSTVELVIQLTGQKSDLPYYYSAHLHFGSLDSQDASIAHHLSPVDSRSLQSRTILGNLSNGSKLAFDDIINFDGHIKVHLADQGPDYQVILVSGNIGSNDNSLAAFNAENLKICSDSYLREEAL